MAVGKISAVTLPVVLMVAMAVLLLAAAPTEGISYMTAWERPGCRNRSQRFSACGCSNFHFRGGYEFVYQGQTAATYNEPNCRGVSDTRFTSSVRNCTPFGWRSIFILC